MTIRNKTTNIYTEWKPLVEALNDDEAGKVFKYIFQYQSGEDVKCFNPVWIFIKSKIDDYNNKGEQISEKRKECGKLGGLAKASKRQQMLANDGKSSNKIKENKTKENKIKQNNIIPSLQDVIDYCNERNNGVDANRWYDYYTANGWKVGRVPMKDWKATVRTWERKQNERGETHQEPMVLIEQGKFYIDEDERYSAGFSDLVKDIPQQERDSLCEWFISKFNGQQVKLSFVRSVLMKKRGE